MTPPATPLRFSPMVEKIEDDEDNIHAQLVEQLLKISRITYAEATKLCGRSTPRVTVS